MAETSDYSGWVPRGTTLNYSSPGNIQSPSSTVSPWEEMSTLTALVILFVALTNDPLSYDPLVVQELPTTPIPESAVTPHLGRGQCSGPGVRYYVC